MRLEKIEEILKNEKPYRLKQVEKALYTDLVQDWEEVTVLPTYLRRRLKVEVPLDLDLEAVSSSGSNSFKAVITLEDGLKVETVLLRHRENRNTVCVSSQVGCPMGCAFCRTASLEFKRNLSSYEIIEQVLFFMHYLKPLGQKVTNVVFMGMGEPFLNYENVSRAIIMLNYKDRFNIGARKISVSTCGILDKIERFSMEHQQVNLAISLNAPDDELRAILMPVARNYPLKELMSSVKKYISTTNRRVMFEYVLIRDLNDSSLHAVRVSDLVRGLLCFVNLIPFNGNKGFTAPSGGKIKEFKRILEENGVAVTQRQRFGSDISAACGQLVYTEEQDS